VGAGGKKFPQPQRGLRNRIGPNERGDIKARRPRGGDQFFLKCGGI
jgi:hypothetical protein